MDYEETHREYELIRAAREVLKNDGETVLRDLMESILNELTPSNNTIEQNLRWEESVIDVDVNLSDIQGGL